ncbi:short-chain dehydrogenase/reductase SDR [Oceanococcus atlanticus]|uniref:Short-chain dehydrogenase/reductase SDR n=1 Tax=Oceanococcus atlanticus TaxID=1317117 RepID=A0A1Y1SDE4_9GAMM|nr:SDR family oxidoreductase [Oceanococcus atlanticus]ORE86335.1 short-chain dehydrogenase/reductase SDR [Oceanococcus atlanticus]
MTDLTNKTIWITGASGGIGEGLALRASARGSRLVLSARREAELERVRQRCHRPQDVAILPCDLESLDDPDALNRQAESFFGPIDLLVNNAGLSQRTLTLDTSVDITRRIMEVDFFAPVALSRAVMPGMLERGHGHIVVVSSVFGHIAMARRSAYAAAKHALHGYFDCARVELGHKGIQFTLACPGFVSTQVSVNALMADGQAFGEVDPDIGKGMPPEVCAERIWRAVEKNRQEVLVAGKEAIAVYFKRFLPLPLYTAFARRLKVH